MTILNIQKQVCRFYGVTMLDLLSRRRMQGICLPRHVAMWLARHTTRATLPEIGRAFGGRDHSTVMHALERIDARLAADPAFARGVAELRDELGSDARRTAA